MFPGATKNNRFRAGRRSSVVLLGVSTGYHSDCCCEMFFRLHERNGPRMSRFDCFFHVVGFLWDCDTRATTFALRCWVSLLGLVVKHMRLQTLLMLLVTWHCQTGELASLTVIPNGHPCFILPSCPIDRTLPMLPRVGPQRDQFESRPKLRLFPIKPPFPFREENTSDAYVGSSTIPAPWPGALIDNALADDLFSDARR